MEQQESQYVEEGRKPYEKPAVVYESTLEVRAGSPLTGPLDPFDQTP